MTFPKVKFSYGMASIEAQIEDLAWSTFWAEHQKEMEQAGFNCKDDVPAYVATIVRAGSPVFYEGGHYRHQRVAVVRSSSGTAILELKQSNGDTIWSVVTAHAGKNINGTRVGAVR